ncbi:MULTISPECIES: Fe-S cluster assembly ATPase SufC [Acidiplasma]|uniref:ABC transporter ATP-binding protein n=2 Tax=Acidiplasma TaxID=507753 RepID=A0A0Q1B3B1_9ARCH|nr:MULTISPECIES: Fe-S cluster assembly ATPase SufC [Acidiplasma]KJE50078.1 ABC transporter ATP-binding protein [Acidiplasma sp. MBA-1]KPV46279.1 ABC transporter ATP-binding protein [Acidiplasma aeolicum]KQB34225.1 ABC transporter ATP-binding protein [Acidiplasma cupricumulans]KQB36696.1 ABC transporter ATP-binding protein [Acidiplasma aeolicum]WMT55792.1 MAG: Fe-S cluster assembly ATPase SufC [Acidiplasma sp.]
MTDTVLEIKNLKVSASGKEILKGINLTVKSGEIHALMGPNGAGKSTLGEALIGHPNYEITDGNIIINGRDVTHSTPEERARQGLFLAFQSPISIPGVKISTFLRTAYNDLYPDEKLPLRDFFNMVKTAMKDLDMDESFISRSVNDGFSGGERKRFEVLQMVILKPKIVILDEIDSGLDVDALKLVSSEIKKLHDSNVGFLIITHYQRILKDIIPEFVHVLRDGKIVLNGGKEISDKIEQEGFEWIEA